MTKTDPETLPTTYRRDEQGLLPAQSAYILELGQTLDPKQAAVTLNYKWRRVREWLRSDKAFQRAYDTLFSAAQEGMQREVELFADEAMNELYKLLTAEKRVTKTFKCTECDTSNSVTVEVRDASTRAKVAEMAMKMSGRLKDVRKLEGEIVHLTFYQKTALEMARRGLLDKVGAQTRLELEEMGYLDAGDVKQIATKDVITVDGRDVREVKE